MSGGRVECPADEMGMEENLKGERPPYKGGYTNGSGGGIKMRTVWLYFCRACICPRTNSQTSPINQVILMRPNTRCCRIT